MKPGKQKPDVTTFYFDNGRDRRVTLNELICYQCAVVKGVNHLIVTVPGGAHIALPVDQGQIDKLDDLVSICDRLAFVMWGIHGQYGVFGIEIPTEDLENA